MSVNTKCLVEKCRGEKLAVRGRKRERKGEKKTGNGKGNRQGKSKGKIPHNGTGKLIGSTTPITMVHWKITQARRAGDKLRQKIKEAKAAIAKSKEHKPKPETKATVPTVNRKSKGTPGVRHYDRSRDQRVGPPVLEIASEKTIQAILKIKPEDRTQGQHRILKVNRLRVNSIHAYNVAINWLRKAMIHNGKQWGVDEHDEKDILTAVELIKAKGSEKSAGVYLRRIRNAARRLKMSNMATEYTTADLADDLPKREVVSNLPFRLDEFVKVAKRSLDEKTARGHRVATVLKAFALAFFMGARSQQMKTLTVKDAPGGGGIHHRLWR